MNKKNYHNNTSHIFLFIYICSIIIYISFFLNFLLILIIFCGFFLFKNITRENYISKKLNQKDIELYINNFNKINNTNFDIHNIEQKNKKFDFPEYIIFCLHASHESYISKDNIKITDRMIELYKTYDNITLYGINYYSSIYFPTEKGIKKNALKIIQNIIDKHISENKIYRIGFDCWSLGTCVGLYCINHIKINKNIQIDFIDLRTPPLNIFNIAYEVVNFFIYSIYPIIIIFQYDDFFNNNIQIKNLMKKYPYISIYFYIPQKDNRINIDEQNQLYNIINYKYYRNIKLFRKGNKHNSHFVIYGYQNQQDIFSI